MAAAVIIAIAVALMAGPAGAGSSGPTCSDALGGLAVHGQHIIGDYVTGIGHASLDWPPAGEVGAAIAGDGVVVRGGPGPGFHFLPEVQAPPGASFCLSQPHSFEAVEHQQAVP